MLHGIHYNVKAFGALGDGTTNDYTAIVNTISAAHTAHQPVFFPATTSSYYVNQTIDLTPYRGTVLIGEGSQGYLNVNGAMGRMSKIKAGPTPSPLFKFDGNASVADLHFENLGFLATENAVRISDAAQVKFKNCAFEAATTGGANNTCVLLENMFWVWFENCDFSAPGTGAGLAGVILRGKEPSPDVDHCYLIDFKSCRFWYQGVLYKDQNDVAVDAANAEQITFDNCSTEAFATTGALIEFQKTASTNWGGRYVKNLSIRNTAFYDYTGSPALVRYAIPNGFDSCMIENVTGLQRVFERTSGTGDLRRCWLAGIENDVYPLKTSAGADIDGPYTVRTWNNHLAITGAATAGIGGFLIFQPTAASLAGIGAGSGTPEGVVTAPPGFLYLNTAGGAATTLYVKQSGVGNTGWVGK
jgi:hypothetical protein